jgi:hypothetical protein
MLRRHSSSYLRAAIIIGIGGPLILTGYVYYFVSTTYAQRQAVRAAQEHNKILDQLYAPRVNAD